MAGKLFKGKETPTEEKKEAKALKSGRISAKQYVAGEKSEGHGAGAAKKATAIKSGSLTPKAYAAEHAMKKGGSVMNGIAKKGKTKGTMVKMCGGGMAKKGK